MSGPDSDNTMVPTRCPSCGVSRNAGNRCDYCGSIYTDGLHVVLHDIYDGLLDRKYKVKKVGRDVEITWRWREPIHFALLASSVVWCSIATFTLFVIVIYEDYTNVIDVIWRPLAHIIPCVLVVACSGLYFCNKTTIKANSQTLSLAHHPILWRGGFESAASDVAEIRVERKLKSRKEKSWDAPVLSIIAKSGRRSILMQGTLEEEFRDFKALQQFLSMALGLEHD